ncbi:hypothetical protein [uncultured Kriegella sp.]|uniref:hypothetical protein n=1 Tax=uncultured Kriegella sp. TaxID=1798910 RepID=UPI0030DA189E|tara:strand:+ start:32850 stop:34289 length:1440 start_codon:yes stop_codon:yes gene_type:complete
MKQVRLSRSITLLFLIVNIVAYGQNESKTYAETFAVDSDAIIEINTSYADIQFETWDRSEVFIEATVTLEDATPEEAEKYFEDDIVEILGNSSKIKISTKENSPFSVHNITGGFKHDFHFEIPEIEPIIVEIPEVAELHELVEMADIPPLPNVNTMKFDYEAYKKDGEKYMKKWQKDFEKGFDKKHQKRMEEWAKRMEERGEHYKELAQKRAEKMKKLHEERARVHEQRAEIHAKRAEAHAQNLSARVASRKLMVEGDRSGNNGPDIFYINSDGKPKNVKVKKVIKVKMPKSVKLRMNVRHGEVRLAENTKNINATLSHASLFAATIDGDQTTVSASYSPVLVERWNYGRLKIEYSDDVELNEVSNLSLSSNSSEVSIERLANRASINNKMGVVRIYSIAPDFSDLEVVSSYGEIFCKLPSSPMNISVNATASEVRYPAKLVLNTSGNSKNILYEGHHIDTTGGRSISIASNFGEVTLE